MLILEYKVAGSKKQYSAIEEAIRIVQFIRNKCVRKWMDGERVSKNDLQCYCAELAHEYSFASLLNSQARQASADRAWFAIQRFFENCREHKPGQKGYPKFQRDNRSVPRIAQRDSSKVATACWSGSFFKVSLFAEKKRYGTLF